MPPAATRVRACSMAVMRALSRGSCPTSSGASARITPVRPWLPMNSLNSDQPTRPSSVVTFRNEKVLSPPSA